MTTTEEMIIILKRIYHMLPVDFWNCLFLIFFVLFGVFCCGFLPMLIEEVENMKLSNKTYDTLKYIAQYVLPALGTLYFALATIWQLPYGEQVVGTITAIDAFLGAILGISTANYNKGCENEDEDADL